MTLIEHAWREFGLCPHAPPLPPPVALPLPAPGTLFALTGPSGAGKTRALNALAAARVTPATEDAPVPALIQGDPANALRTLAACGLADGRLWALRACQLSSGEQQRLGLARVLARCGPGALVAADEFDAHLDADGARALAINLRRLAAARGLRLIVSTHRPELLPFLGPARVLQLDGALTEQPAPAALELTPELEFTPGRLRDYAPFARWHYLGPARPGPTAAVWLARLKGRPVAAAVFCWPHLLLSARARALPHLAARRVLAEGAGALNRDLRLLSRLVVDPRLRGCGVAAALLRHALPRLGVPHVECLAQMGGYSGFLLRAGFENAGALEPPRAVARLRAWLSQRGLGAHELIDPARRGALYTRHVELPRLLAALLRSRVQTGHGALRQGGGNAEAALQAALARIYAAPAYFLWRRTQ